MQVFSHYTYISLSFLIGELLHLQELLTPRKLTAKELGDKYLVAREEIDLRSEVESICHGQPKQ
jgi:hypothetical protein